MINQMHESIDNVTIPSTNNTHTHTTTTITTTTTTNHQLRSKRLMAIGTIVDWKLWPVDGNGHIFQKKKELRRELCTCYELTVHIIHMTLVSAKRNVAIRAKKNPTNHLATRLGDIRDVTARWRYDWSISAWFICHCVAELWTLAANRIKFLFVFFFYFGKQILFTHTHTDI